MSKDIKKFIIALFVIYGSVHLVSFLISLTPLGKHRQQQIQEFTSDFKALQQAVLEGNLPSISEIKDRPSINNDSELLGMNLIIGMASNQIDLTEFLLESGANPNAQFKHLPLLYSALASKYGEDDDDIPRYDWAVRMLLEYGANPNVQFKGTWALHKAIMENDVEMVKLLLKYGADPNLYTQNSVNKNDCTQTMDLAYQTNNPEMINLLKQKISSSSTIRDDLFL